MANRRIGPSGSGSSAAERGRWSARRKAEVVLRILRGEDLDSLSRELGVTAATLALCGGTSSWSLVSRGCAAGVVTLGTMRWPA
jgi:hypothetical protein